MFTKQKIKKLIVIFSIMFALTLTCVFHSVLHPFFIDLFATRFEIVSNKNNLLVHFINIGQGDATAINFPDGKVMLIDTGCEESNTTYVKYLKENVISTQRKNYIDYLVLSHADMDHCGGTMKLLKNFKIGTVFMPKLESNSQGYQEILEYVENNCKFEVLGEEFVVENTLYAITFFEILKDNNTNDSSQVVKVESANQSFLFVGDISSRVETLYVEKYGKELDVDVLKVSHHGSNTATSEYFLDCVTPKYAVISVGAENDYGHPTGEVLEILKENHIDILRTDIHENVLFVVGKDYHLFQISGKYFITSLSLNYMSFVMVVDCCLIVMSVIVIIKKEKKKRVRGNKK